MGEKLDTLNEGIRIGKNILGDVKWNMTPAWKRELIVREHAEATKQQLTYYCDRLEKNVQIFTMKARQMELRGSHSAAVTAARYVLTLRNMRDRADGMMMRFEMMESMKDMKVAQQDFVKNCEQMGRLMAPGINPARWVDSKESLNDAMHALDEMDALTQSMFGPIDQGNPFARGVEDSDAEDLLGDIIHVYNGEDSFSMAEPVMQPQEQMPVAAQPILGAMPQVVIPEKPATDPEVDAMLRELKARARGK